DPRRTVTLEEQMRVLPPAEYDIHLTIDQREYYGVVEQEAIPTGSSSEAGAGAHLRWGLATDQGKQRDHNEDYLEGWICSRGNRPLLALFIVADGLGGQDSGEIASRMTVDIVWQQVKTALWDRIIADDIPEQTQFPAALRAAVTAANTEVHRARLERSSQMSSTVTTALVYGGSAYIANVGDSRTYIFGQHGLQRITKDHSLVQRLVDTGQIKPEDVYSHPRRNLIYQSIGDRQDVVVDLYTYEFKPDERLILCSDGLWEMVHDDGLEEVLLAEADPQQACDRLVKNANMAGGEDNISVIVALV
ncbi:MAG: protein phosphatase 2C domain-containing protein, partial [Chloroflexi bacterium]|nr:protein phosphatase 2C domain-containing protein [Chloroflexota bacterium]